MLFVLIVGYCPSITSSTCLITYCYYLMIIKNIITTFRYKYRYKCFYNISSCIKLSSIYILIKSTNKIFKYIPHFD